MAVGTSTPPRRPRRSLSDWYAHQESYEHHTQATSPVVMNPQITDHMADTCSPKLARADHSTSPSKKTRFHIVDFFIGDVDTNATQKVLPERSLPVCTQTFESQKEEQQHVTLEKAVRTLCFEYFENNVMPMLKCMQQAQKELEVQVAELRADLKNLEKDPDLLGKTALSNKFADLKELYPGGDHQDKDNSLADQQSHNKPQADILAQDKSLPSTGLESSRRNIDDVTLDHSDSVQQIKTLQDELKSLREELRNAREVFSWRRLGESSPSPIISDVVSEVGSFVGSLGGCSVAESVANSALGTTFAKGMRDVRDRLLARKQRKSLLLNNLPLEET